MAMPSLVLLTRPEGENESLAGQLGAINIQTIQRPLLKLSAFELNGPLLQPAIDLDRYDKIIFVSKSAVRHAMPVLDGYWPQWPIRLTWLAVGQGTALLLDHYHVRALYPLNAGSEGLLELPQLADSRDERVLIVRGRGGRELIGLVLQDRGMTIEYWEVYERSPIEYTEWSSLSRSSTKLVVVLTSGEILSNFLQQAPALVPAASVVVPSERIAHLARAAGFREVKNAGGASDQALYDAILTFV